MREVKEIVPQMFVVSCIIVDLVYQGVAKKEKKIHIFLERLFVDGKNGIPMLRLAIDLI